MRSQCLVGAWIEHGLTACKGLDHSFEGQSWGESATSSSLETLGLSCCSNEDPQVARLEQRTGSVASVGRGAELWSEEAKVEPRWRPAVHPQANNEMTTTAAAVTRGMVRVAEGA